MSKKYINFLITGLFLCISSFLLTGESPAFSFLVSPSKVELICEPSGKITFNLRVINTEKRSQGFKVYLTDLRLTREGKLQFPFPGKEKRSCAEWIEVKPSKFFLQPFETETVLCDVNVQEGYEGELYATVMVESEEKALFRVAVPVFLLIKGKELVKKVSFLPVKVEKSFNKNVLQFTVPVKNEGNVRLKVEGRARIRDKWGRVWFEFPLTSRGGTIFPESIRYLKANIKESLLLARCFLEISIAYKSSYENKTTKTMAIFPFDLENWSAGSISLYPLPFVVNPSLIVINSASKKKSAFVEISSVKDTNSLSFRASLNPSPNSCRVEVVPEEFVVLPGERRKVRLNINIPDNPQGNHYRRVIFHGAEAEKSSLSYGVTIFTLSDKPRRRCHLLSLKVEDDIQPQLVLRLKNPEDAFIKIKGIINMEDERGMNLLKHRPFDQGEFLVFPGEVVNLTAALPHKISPGNYIVYLKIFSGEKQILQTKKKITIK